MAKKKEKKQVVHTAADFKKVFKAVKKKIKKLSAEQGGEGGGTPLPKIVRPGRCGGCDVRM